MHTPRHWVLSFKRRDATLSLSLLLAVKAIGLAAGCWGGFTEFGPCTRIKDIKVICYLLLCNHQVGVLQARR